MAKKKPANKKNSEPNSLSEIKRLYNFMTGHKLECIEFSRDDFKVRLVRKGRSPAPVVVPSGGAFQPDRQAPVFAVPPGPPARPPGSETICSPIMGIFYRSPSPSSPPFFREGDTAKAGQVLCLVEAMKVFNEVKTQRDCTILQVLVENGKPVKTGQELFLVKRK